MATNPTLSDLQTDLDGRLSSSATSGFWTVAQKDLAINEAGQQVCNTYRWPFLELALTTPTRNKQEYYDYPDGANVFSDDSIYQIDIDGETYESRDGRKRINWGEFQRRKNIGDSNRKLFANHNGYFFLYPIPQDGKEMTLYGLKEWVVLITGTDKSVVPSSLQSSIVQIALARCLRKAKKYNEAQAELTEVLDPNIGLLVTIWNKMNEENAAGYMGEGLSSHW